MKRKTLIEKILPEYKVNKLLMNIIFLLMLVLFFYLWSTYNFTNLFEPNVISIECPDEYRQCENPLWIACNPASYRSSPLSYDICNVATPDMYASQFMQSGEFIGERPSWLLKNFSLIIILMFLFGLGLNHILFNRNYKRRVKR